LTLSTPGRAGLYRCNPGSKADLYRAGVVGGALFGAVFPVVFLIVGSAVMTTPLQPNAGQASLAVSPLAIPIGVVAGVLTGLAAATLGIFGGWSAGRITRHTTRGVAIGAFTGAAVMCWFATDTILAVLPADLIFTSVAAVIGSLGLAGIWSSGSVVGVFRRSR
jgi:hypothetical protein